MLFTKPFALQVTERKGNYGFQLPRNVTQGTALSMCARKMIQVVRDTGSIKVLDAGGGLRDNNTERHELPGTTRKQNCEMKWTEDD